MSNYCRKCGSDYDCHDGFDPTIFCDTCAQIIVERLAELVPEPPKAITWEMGVEILNVIQEQIHCSPHPKFTKKE